MDTQDLLILKYLRMFKNITKTANALFITQPALTRRIQQLEKELGTKLIESNNKGIRFTPTGVEATIFAEEELRNLENFKNRLLDIEAKEQNIITIAAPSIICEYYLPSVVRSFKDTHPQVKFLITMAPSSVVVSLTNTKKCDFGFLRNDFGWDDEEKLLLTTNYIVAASLKPFSLKDLSHMNRVAYTADGYYMKLLDLWWNTNFKTPPKIDVEVNSVDLCREMVLRGIGFGLLPSVLIPSNPKIHHMILNDKNGNPIQRHTYLIYKKENITTPIKREFLDFLRLHPFDHFLLVPDI